MDTKLSLEVKATTRSVSVRFQLARKQQCCFISTDGGRHFYLFQLLLLLLYAAAAAAAAANNFENIGRRGKQNSVEGISDRACSVTPGVDILTPSLSHFLTFSFLVCFPQISFSVSFPVSHTPKESCHCEKAPQHWLLKNMVTFLK